MAFVEVYKSARVIEALENFALSDIQELPELSGNEPVRENLSHLKDKEFWYAVFAGQQPWRSKVYFQRCVFSEWLPRIPGLYFTPGGKSMRQVSEPGEIILNPDGIRVYNPWEKSQKIMGGLGSHKISP